jgi:hypothetical protein
MSVEARNNHKSRVIRDSLRHYIGFTIRPFNDLTRRSHSSFAWYAVASSEGECFVIPTAI